MNLILDTHVLIWWEDDPANLSPAALRLLSDPNNHLVASLVSFWEMVIKTQTGKLILPGSIRDFMDRQVVNGLSLLPITTEHILALEALPPIHKDPFDRLLIAQAITESATIVSADRVFRLYPASTLW